MTRSPIIIKINTTRFSVEFRAQPVWGHSPPEHWNVPRKIWDFMLFNEQKCNLPTGVLKFSSQSRRYLSWRKASEFNTVRSHRKFKNRFDHENLHMRIANHNDAKYSDSEKRSSDKSKINVNWSEFQLHKYLNWMVQKRRHVKLSYFLGAWFRLSSDSRKFLTSPFNLFIHFRSHIWYFFLFTILLSHVWT